MSKPAHHLDELIACEQCDQLQRRLPLPTGGIACCHWCGSKLYRRDRCTLDHSLALTITSLLLFAITISFPLLTMNMSGRIEQMSLIDSGLALFYEGIPALSALVILTILLAPLLELFGLLYILCALRWMPDRLPGHLQQVFRMVNYLTPWGMLEVFMLGILVSAVKLADLATIITGPGLIALALLILTLTALTSSLNKPEVWKRLGNI